MSNPITYSLFSIPSTASRWVIAYSGGVDSHVLLHLAQQATQQQKKSILAVHIHHGLHANADAWAAHCEKICADLHVPCQIINVTINTDHGESLEAAARDARYQAFANIIQEGDVLLTAQHQDDQAETLLLQLLRGAGVKGLAGMGENKFDKSPLIPLFQRGKQEEILRSKQQHNKSPHIIRPFLQVSRAEIIAYAEQNHLQWMHDDSNDNTRFDRNFLRHDIMPLLIKRWPAAKQNIARSSQHCAEADALLMELGRQDYQSAVMIKKLNLPAFLETGIVARLAIAPLLDLSAMRQKNALRTWFTDLAILQPSEIKLAHIVQDVLMSRDDSHPVVAWEQVEMRCFDNELYLCHPLREFEKEKTYAWDLQTELDLPIGKLALDPAFQEDCRVAALLATTMRAWQAPTEQVGVAISNNEFKIKFRQGSERFHPAGRKHSQVLKKLFQEWQVPTWLRDRIPLLYYQDELIAVLGYALSDILATRNN